MISNTYEDISIEKLLVNNENARHEDLENETDAINWLIDNLPERMKKLSHDILDKGDVYDPPLVCKQGNSYKIYDGNRRVSCVKMLSNPSIIKNKDKRIIFEKLQKQFGDRIPQLINCRIENDISVINDIVERRHAGGDSGIGQMQWGPEEKDNFFRRTNSPYYKPKLSTELNHLLKNEKILEPEQKINLSIFDRLLSNEHYRGLVGLTFKKRTLLFIKDRKASLEAIKRIIRDAENGKINLYKAWDNIEKDKYFATLAEDKILPKIPSNDYEFSNKEIVESEKTKSKPKAEKPSLRTRLIPDHIILPQKITAARLKNVFIELRHELYFSNHTNAISVMFRVLLELSIDYFIKHKKIEVISKNKHEPTLAQRFTACLEFMYNQEEISKQERGVLIKFVQPEQFLSIDTFNGYVHHSIANPTQAELIAKWDTLEKFILLCLNSEKEFI